MSDSGEVCGTCRYWAKDATRTCTPEEAIPGEFSRRKAGDLVAMCYKYLGLREVEDSCHYYAERPGGQLQTDSAARLLEIAGKYGREWVLEVLEWGPEDIHGEAFKELCQMHAERDT